MKKTLAKRMSDFIGDHRPQLIAGVGIVISTAVAWTLDASAKVDRNLAITFGFLTEIFIVMISFSLEARVWPPEYRKLRRDSTKAKKASEGLPILGIVFDATTNNLRRNLKQISQGQFTDDSASIPDLSIETVKSLQSSAFVTYLVDNEVFYANSAGKKYLDAWYEKARQLPPESLCRVFILNDLDCPEITRDIINQHLSHKLHVRIIMRHKAHEIAAGCSLDFGIFDQTCLMTVEARSKETPASLSVFVDQSHFNNADKLSQYKRFREKLLAEENTDDYPSFLEKFNRPVNEEFWIKWLQDRGSNLVPPHGVSSKDSIMMLQPAFAALKNNSRKLRVAVLGLTPTLMKACIDSDRIESVVLLDQTRVAWSDLPVKVNREAVNWLSYRPETRFDIVLGDECLNNLNLRQYSSFFKNLHDHILNPHGVVVLRCMGQFNEDTASRDATKREFKEAVQSKQNPRTALSMAWVIRFLHSKDFGFSREKMEINSVRYNQIIETMIEDGELTEDQCEGCFFPSRNSPSLVLSSPTNTFIAAQATKYFHLAPFKDLDEGYGREDESISSYYKILTFSSYSAPETRRVENDAEKKHPVLS